MRLERVEILNFRSIKDVIVKFDPSCRVLVGINESGKSNILSALSFLGESYKPVRQNDLREASPTENPIDNAHVRFVFRFEKSESDKLHKDLASKILASAKNPEIVLANNKKRTLKEFCSARNEGLYSVDIINETKSFKYWLIRSGRLLAGWKKPTSVCPPDFTIEYKSQNYQISQYKLIRSADFPSIPDEYLEEAEINDLAKLSGEATISITKENLPNLLFWEYDENNLLPNNINIDSFSSDPNTCIPLKNMFSLAGITDIATSIASAKVRGNNQFQNYLNGIARKNTDHFRSVWKEYKQIEFSLRLNANQIEPGVKEINTLDFSKRSDGFKRFVTFLLIISVNVKTDSLTDTLLLIDEPEISLHPEGARFLRDELIRISKKNYVTYSTHSIFMIDPGDIGRHYIVKKKNEITTIESAKNSNIADEEVIYNALGHSVFAVLKEKNLIFEGWKDKHLFFIALQVASEVLKTKFKKVSVCHAKGVGSIKTITPMIELAQRKCMIISDSDKPAKDQQKKYIQEKGFGEWKTYQDIDSTIIAITGEDFITNDFIATQINTCLTDSSMPTFDSKILPKANKVNFIGKWLAENGMTNEQANVALINIKNSIFEDLIPKHIEDTYKKLLEGISL